MKKNELAKEFIAKNGKVVQLRPATSNDAAHIVRAVNNILNTGAYIQKESARSEEEEKSFITEMNRLDNMYVAVEIENEIVGIARVIRGELEMKRHTGLFRTWLVDSAQGNGIGSHLMKYTLDWCRMHDLHKLCLTVFASNGLAHKLYERYGFIREGVQKEQILINGDYDDEIFMAYFFKA